MSTTNSQSKRKYSRKERSLEGATSDDRQFILSDGDVLEDSGRLSPEGLSTTMRRLAVKSVKATNKMFGDKSDQEGQCKTWDFTYHAKHMDEVTDLHKFMKRIAERLVEFFTTFEEEVTKGANAGDSHLLVTDYGFQWERGEETGKEHIQGRVRFYQYKRLTQILKVFNENGILSGAHWSRTSTAGSRSFKYVIKDETRVEGLPNYNNCVNLVSGDALIDDWALDNYPIQPFETQVLDILNDRHERAIHIMWDPPGGAGKSKILRRLYITKKVDVLFQPISDSRRAQEDLCDRMIRVIKLRGGRRWNGEYPRIAVDVERSYCLYKNKMAKILFGALERAKSCYLTDSRNRSHEAMFPPPVVIVFCNHLPPARDNWCSSDRPVYWLFNQETQLFDRLDGRPSQEEIRRIQPSVRYDDDPQVDSAEVNRLKFRLSLVNDQLQDVSLKLDHSNVALCRMSGELEEYKEMQHRLIQIAKDAGYNIIDGKIIPPLRMPTRPTKSSS